MELEDHNAEREAQIAQAKADRQAELDANRPNWRNSLADLLEWQEATKATAEEMSEDEDSSIRLAGWLMEVGATKLLAGRFWLRNYYEAEFYIGKYDESGNWSHDEQWAVQFSNDGLLDIKAHILSSEYTNIFNKPIPTDRLKEFFNTPNTAPNE